MGYPMFARQLKVGDLINGHEDGWLKIKKISKHKFSSLQNISIVFTNGMSKTYGNNDRVDAIRQ